MSYPDPVYFGTGEVPPRYRPVDTPADLPRPGGTASYLATEATTSGRFGLYRWDLGPDVAGARPNYNRTISESFFVLSGTVRLFDGNTWLDAHPGDFMYVPDGGLHGFRNESGELTSLLIPFAPGAPREAYFGGAACRAVLDRLGEGRERAPTRRGARRPVPPVQRPLPEIGGLLRAAYGSVRRVHECVT